MASSSIQIKGEVSCGRVAYCNYIASGALVAMALGAEGVSGGDSWSGCSTFADLPMEWELLWSSDR